MLPRFGLARAAHRNAETRPDRLRDGTHADALFGNAVQAGSGRGMLECQAEQPRRVEPVHRRPAVRTVAGERGKPDAARHLDQHGDEAVIPRAMHRGRQPHDADPHAALRRLQVLTDFAALPPGERNLLRRLFSADGVRAALPDWEANARFVLATFRLDAARAGDGSEAAALAGELVASSADFRRLWAENEVRSHGAGVKRIRHPVAGPLTLEYSAFPVDGADGLSMIVFTPASAPDARAIEGLVAGRTR